MQFVHTLNGNGLGDLMQRTGGEILSTPVIIPSDAEQKQFLFNLFPADHPFRQRFLQGILTLNPLSRMQVVAALMDGRVQPQDMFYQSYGQIIQGQSVVNVIVSGQTKDNTRNIENAKLEAFRWFLICAISFHYGRAVDSLLIDNAVFDAIENDNNAAGTPNLIKMRVPTQIDNGNYNFRMDKELYRDKAPLSGMWSHPYSKEANREELYNPKWYYPQIESELIVNGKGTFVVPEGSSDWLKVKLWGIELRVSQTT